MALWTGLGEAELYGQNKYDSQSQTVVAWRTPRGDGYIISLAVFWLDGDLDEPQMVEIRASNGVDWDKAVAMGRRILDGLGYDGEVLPVVRYRDENGELV